MKRKSSTVPIPLLPPLIPWEDYLGRSSSKTQANTPPPPWLPTAICFVVFSTREVSSQLATFTGPSSCDVSARDGAEGETWELREGDGDKQAWILWAKVCPSVPEYKYTKGIRINKLSARYVSHSENKVSVVASLTHLNLSRIPPLLWQYHIAEVTLWLQWKYLHFPQVGGNPWHCVLPVRSSSLCFVNSKGANSHFFLFMFTASSNSALS